MTLTFLKLIPMFLMVISCVIIQSQLADCYKTEIAITPLPTEELTTKRTGFFGGIKKLFRGHETTTTTTAPILRNEKLPKLQIPEAPLMSLGPRPDSPPTSPITGTSQQFPQWPQPQVDSKTTKSQNTPNTAQITPVNLNGSISPKSTIFGPYQPPKPQPSDIDLSYGSERMRPKQPLTQHSGDVAKGYESTPTDIDLRMVDVTDKTTITMKTPANLPKKDILPVRDPSIKEDFPALPTSKVTTPTSNIHSLPEMPTAWNQPLPKPSQAPITNIKTTPSINPNNNDRIAFIGTTTVRPGVPTTLKSLATDDEIKTLTESLFAKEVNSQMSLIRLSAQGKTRSIDSTDEAPQPLLEIDAKAFETPTIAKMRLLFNNYEMDTMVNEHVTANERKEENDFLDAVMATQVMRQAMLFLQNKGLVSPDPKTHKDLVKELWFTQYSRGNGKIGSSGFEHVFVNEVKNGTIIGLHNWVYFYDEEKAGRLDYKGYLNQLDLGTKGKIMKIRFTHNGLNKPVNTLFIGTSPELELALYTICFQLKPDRTCPVSLNGKTFGIVTYSWRYRGKNLIGSAYPEI